MSCDWWRAVAILASDWLTVDRQIIETFAGIKDQSVVGVRAPYLKVGGDTQFK